MSYPDADWPSQRRPEIPVVVRNASDLKTPQLRATKTVPQQYIVDGSNSDPSKRFVQICGYEPTRRRMVIYSHDAPVNFLTESPKISPDTAAAATPLGQGVTIPQGGTPWEFWGCDAVWLNAGSSTPTRVVVVKEYE